MQRTRLSRIHAQPPVYYGRTNCPGSLLDGEHYPRTRDLMRRYSRAFLGSMALYGTVRRLDFRNKKRGAQNHGGKKCRKIFQGKVLEKTPRRMGQILHRASPPLVWDAARYGSGRLHLKVLNKGAATACNKTLPRYYFYLLAAP